MNLNFKFDRMKNYQLLISVLSLLMMTLPARSQSPEDEQLDVFFKKYLEDCFRLQPFLATSLGDHRFDSQLDDVSPKARAGWLALVRQTLDALPKRVDYKKLSRDSQIDFEIFQQHLKTEIWETENLHPFEDDPRTYGNYISDSVYQLLSQSTLPKETNIANCIARMMQMPRIIAEAEKTLAHPPRPILETAILQNRGAINFYENGIFQFAGDTPQLDRLKTAAASVVALLTNYQNFLEGPLMARAPGDWRLGRAKFTRKFELETGVAITAGQNLADAEVEFESVRRDMYVVARQLWCQYFPEKPLPPDDAEGARATVTQIINAVNQTHGRPEDLISDARATVANIKAFIRKRNYVQLPNPDLCQIVEMPEFRRGNSLAYMDNAPPLDPAAQSYYAVSPPSADWNAGRVKSFLEEYNHYMLQILTIHEAFPGHYVQLAQAAQASSLIRRVYQSGVYVEGWAVYGEITMLNEGYGDGDLRLRLMQLKFYLRAVANSILDYKMHCTRMTDGEALKFLTRDAFQSDAEARLKLVRAKQSSVQLSTYFVGRMAHYRLHQQIEREMGGKFSLAAYHNAVIAPGSVPVKYLPELVRQQLGLPIDSGAGKDGR
jgi:uncharacterized protein (DUF885 family)